MKNYRLYTEYSISEEFSADSDIHAVYLATKKCPNELKFVYVVKDNGVSVCIFDVTEYCGEV